MSSSRYLSNFFGVIRIRFVCAVVLICWLPVANAMVGVDPSVIGRWKLTAARGYAEITSRDEKEAQELLGKVFIIRKEKIQFDKEFCGPPKFEARDVDVGLFLREEFHARAANLGLPKSATAVDLSCTTVFIKSPKKLLIFWDGWFFDAVRIR